MLLFTNQYISVNFLELQQITTFHFSDDAKKLNICFLKAELILAVENMIKRYASHFFIDIANIEHIIQGDFFIWFENNIISNTTQSQQTKVAWIASKQINFKSIPNSAKSIHKIFTNHQLATQWLVDDVKYEFGKHH